MAAFVILVVALSTGATQVGDVSSVVLAGPAAPQTNYATPVTAVADGGTMTFHNLDIFRHDVVAVHDHHGPDDNPWCEAFEEGHCPAFWSPLIGMGEQAEVLGVDALEPGTYAFYCTAHASMEGTLVVLPGAAE